MRLENKFWSGFFVFTALFLHPNFAGARNERLPVSQIDLGSRGSSMVGLVEQYNRGSDLVRPGIAVQIKRSLPALERDGGPLGVVALGRIVLSRQAAFEDRKDLALREARLASTIAGGIITPDGRGLRAQAAVVTAQALMLKEEYLLAATTISVARRAHGPATPDNDQPWDELTLWETIIRTNTPTRLQVQVRDAGLNEADSARVLGGSKVECGTDDKRLRKISGAAPVYPVMSGFNGKVGGVALRSIIDAQGNTTRASVTAFAPNEGFAAAVEAAAITWRYEVPADLPKDCRDSHLSIVAFGMER